MDDLTLLRGYAESGSEEDFASLVRRHIDHVYSVALRETADPQLADDVTQATFLILARKAAHLGAGTILSGWLFKTARFAARNLQRSERRRQMHEKEAAAMSRPERESNPEAPWEELAPLLNDALASLSETDRAAVLLRYFEKKGHAEIAGTLGTSEVSARKRLSRAVDRLRAFFNKRGVSVTSASVLTFLSDHAVNTAPAELARTIASAAAISAGTATASISSIVEQTLKLMAWTKLKTTAVVTGVLLLSGSTAVVVPKLVNHFQRVQRLPGGTTFSLLRHEMTDRFDFQYESDRWWAKPLRSVLPRAAVNRLAGSPGTGRIVASSADGEALFIATLEKGLPGLPLSNVGRLQVVGDDGSVSDGIFSAGTIVMNECAQIWNANPYPRRARELTLRFFITEAASPQAWKPVAEFVIDNPVSGPFPSWNPEALPATRTASDLAVTLNTLETGVPYDGSSDSLSSFWKVLPATRATLSIRQEEKSRCAWNVRKITVSDATGNRWTPHGLSVRATPDATPDLEVNFLGALWENEPAWNLRFELSRTNDFAPEELLTVADIPVPQPDEVLTLNHSYEVNGVPVHLVGISAVGAKLPQPFEWSQVKDHVNLALKAKGRDQDKRFTLVSVQDEHGRAVEFTDKRARSGSDLVFGLRPPSDARQLSFTFAVHQSRHVEFVVKPVQAMANAKK